MAINVQQKTERQIRVPFGMRKEIAATMKCTGVTVWNALTYKTHSKRACAIRAYAIEKLKESNT